MEEVNTHRAEEPDIHPEDGALKDGTSLFDLVGAKYVESMEHKIPLTENGRKNKYKKEPSGTFTSMFDPKGNEVMERITFKGQTYILSSNVAELAACWPPAFAPPFDHGLICSKCGEGPSNHGYIRKPFKTEEEYEMEDRKYKTGSYAPNTTKPVDVRYSHQADLEKDADPVNHPAHYTAYKGLEIIQLTEQMNFNRGNAVKYIARAGLKEKSTEIEDLEKAKWYIQREIERISE